MAASFSRRCVRASAAEFIRLLRLSRSSFNQCCSHYHVLDSGITSRSIQTLLPAVRKYSNIHKVEDTEEDDILYKKIDIELKGHDPAVLQSYEKYFRMTLKELELKARITTPPKIHERYTLLKSVHIYKKHRVQYETRTHFKLIEMKYLTGSTADTLLEYVQRNLPEGVAMRVTKTAIEPLPDHIQTTAKSPMIEVNKV